MSASMSISSRRSGCFLCRGFELIQQTWPCSSSTSATALPFVPNHPVQPTRWSNRSPLLQIEDDTDRFSLRSSTKQIGGEFYWERGVPPALAMRWKIALDQQWIHASSVARAIFETKKKKPTAFCRLSQSFIVVIPPKNAKMNIFL